MILENLEKFDLDTKQSIIKRIAAELGTHPDYLYFPRGFSEEKIEVEDILQKIKEDSSQNTDFLTFLFYIENQVENLRIKEDILYPWLVYNKEIEKLYELGGMTFVLPTVQPLIEKGYFEDEEKFKDFWINREDIKNDIDRKIQSNISENKKAIKLYRTFDEIEEGMPYTELVLHSVSLQVYLDLKDITLLEIFNHVYLNENIPFAKVQEYYKILKDFDLPEEWAKEVESEDEILLKISERKTYNKIQDFINVLIKVQEDNVISSMKLNTIRGYLSQEEFLSRFVDGFRGLGEIKYSNINETEVIGVFYFPYQRINTYVFSDMVMMNPLFSSLIVINEANKTTKKQGEYGQPWLHIHFDHVNVGHITAGISQKVVNRTDKEMRDTDEEIFAHGDPYIRVRVKGRDKKSVETFQKMLSKLLVIYQEKYDKIVQVYEKFLPDFGLVTELEVEPLKRKPEYYAPEIFVKNFSRNCSEKRIPSIISKKEAKDYKSQGKQVLRFPRNRPDSEPYFPSDGVSQKYYVCLNPDYPYPGVRKNELQNKEDYPYVPCCFKENQQNKRGGYYRKYFYNEEKSSDIRQQLLIKTNKILNSEQYGILPLNLKRLFDILDMEPGYTYIRVGVKRNKHSFLNAVMVSLHEQTGIFDLDDNENRERRLREIREELSSKQLAPLARQCAYNYTISELRENIRNPDTYFDPKLYTQLLEVYFNCNIYLFNDTKMFLPNHIQSYYKDENRNAPSVFIFEHMGSESDHATYPQCELIVRWPENTKDTQYVFPFDQKISKRIDNIFSIIRESYILDKIIPETVFNLSDQVKIKSQEIDNYGKTRKIDVIFEKDSYTLLTSPIQPVIAKEKKTEINFVSGEKAIAFFERMNGGELSQTVKKGKTKEISGIIGNVTVTIPVFDHDVFEGLTVNEEEIHYPVSKESVISIYNRNKKLARYITEYVFWLFSKYMSEKERLIVSDKLLNKFAKEYLVIKEDFVYENIPKTFSMNSGVMYKKKLVVTSEDMLKRLLYVLKLYSIRDLNSLLNYRKKSVITHYYMDITDFSYFPQQVILHGEDSIEKWIQENKFHYVLTDKISIQTRPYFFKNPLVENKVFLAQNADSLEVAFAIVKKWYKKDYNPGPFESVKNTFSFTLYLYVNETDISSRNVVGKETLEQTVRILGYKISEKSYYTVLLEI